MSGPCRSHERAVGECVEAHVQRVRVRHEPPPAGQQPQLPLPAGLAHRGHGLRREPRHRGPPLPPHPRPPPLQPQPRHAPQALSPRPLPPSIPVVRRPRVPGGPRCGPAHPRGRVPAPHRVREDAAPLHGGGDPGPAPFRRQPRAQQPFAQAPALHGRGEEEERSRPPAQVVAVAVAVRRGCDRGRGRAEEQQVGVLGHCSGPHSSVHRAPGSV